MVAITLVMCLLVSATFDAAETVLWAESFLKSVAMQVLLTNTLLTLGTLLLKLFFSWLLLLAGRKHQRKREAKALQQRKEAVAKEATAAEVRAPCVRSWGMNYLATAAATAVATKPTSCQWD
jgi:hypothetical protein